jgi:DNA modification methylase
MGDVIDRTYSGNKLHPTQKPVSVLLPLIETFSPSGALVLDPFAGSGPTLVAARMLGRKWLGVELDHKYHALACRRLSQRQTHAGLTLPETQPTVSIGARV